MSALQNFFYHTSFMKYLYLILAIVLTTTLVSVFWLWPEKNSPGNNDILFTINGQNYDRDTIVDQYSKFGYHSGNTEELVDTAITRELLIQEAQRQNIDREESFRVALKSFYETSLIKVLIERKEETIEVKITENEIDDYIFFRGKIVTFTKLDHIPKSQLQAASATGQSTTAQFDDLALPLRLLLSSLTIGSFEVKFDTGNGKYAIRLDKVEPSADDTIHPTDRQKIREILREHKREQIINSWNASLRSQASIIINDGND